MTGTRYHLQDQNIPECFVIYEPRLDVQGIQFRKEAAHAFAQTDSGWLEFERDPDNQHDPNAIRIIGCTSGLLSTKRRFIGFVQKDIARLLVDLMLTAEVRPRLLKTYVGSGGYVEIQYQIVGPVNRKREYRQAVAST